MPFFTSEADSLATDLYALDTSCVHFLFSELCLTDGILCRCIWDRVLLQQFSPPLNGKHACNLYNTCARMGAGGSMTGDIPVTCQASSFIIRTPSQISTSPRIWVDSFSLTKPPKLRLDTRLHVHILVYVYMIYTCTETRVCILAAIGFNLVTGDTVRTVIWYLCVTPAEDTNTDSKPYPYTLSAGGGYQHRP